MSLYLSALQIFLSLKGKSLVEGDSTAPEGTEGTNEPKKNDDTKKEQKADIFISSNEAETAETQATKPKTWLEQIADTGKKAFDTVSEQTGEIISVAKNLWDRIMVKSSSDDQKSKVTLNPEKGKSQNNKPDNRVWLSLLQDEKNEKQEREEEQKRRQEQERQEQINHEKQTLARMRENQLHEDLLKRTEELNNQEKKNKIAKSTPINTKAKSLVAQYSHLLFGLPITEQTSASQVANYLLRTNQLSLDQNKELLVHTASDTKFPTIASRQASLNYSA